MHSIAGRQRHFVFMDRLPRTLYRRTFWLNVRICYLQLRFFGYCQHSIDTGVFQLGKVPGSVRTGVIRVAV